MNDISKRNEWLAVILIFVIGGFFHLYRFDSIPYGLNHDAAQNGLIAIDLWQKLPTYVPYYAGWVGETLYHYWLIVVFSVFGITTTALRIAPVLIGITTLPVFYILARLLQGRVTALFSLFFLAISGWHITMSKAGWLAILVPLFQSLSILLLYKSLQTNRNFFWIMAGASLAITLNTYTAARITPLIFVVILLFWLFRNRGEWRRIRKGIVLLSFTFFVVIQPLAQFAIHHWETYTSRASFLSVTNHIKETESIKPLIENITISLGMLHYRANGDDFFVSEPLLEPIPGIIFLIGFVATLGRVRKFEQFIIIMWFLLGFVPGILSVPNGNHNFSMLIPLYLLIGEGAAFSYLFLKRENRLQKISQLLLFLIVLLSIATTYREYLSKERREIFGFYPETTIVAQYMKAHREKFDFYLTDNYPRDALTFITYASGNPFEKHYQWFDNGHAFLEVVQQEKGLLFFMFATKQNEILAEQLLKKFPGAEKLYLWYNDDNISRKASLVIRVFPPT